MKYLLALALFLSAQAAFASPAVEYVCVGKNLANKEAVAFDLTFSDYGREEGYTNQAITITRIAYDRLEKPVTLQMFGAKKENECQKNESGELYLNTFKMEPAKEGDLAAYVITFRSKCAADHELNVKAYCFFEH